MEIGADVVIIMDSLTRLARAYNTVTQSSGKTLSGGLDPLAMHFPKKFFGSARNIENGGSLTIMLVNKQSKQHKVRIVVHNICGNFFYDCCFSCFWRCNNQSPLTLTYWTDKVNHTQCNVVFDFFLF